MLAQRLGDGVGGEKHLVRRAKESCLIMALILQPWSAQQAELASAGMDRNFPSSPSPRGMLLLKSRGALLNSHILSADGKKMKVIVILMVC